jgi:hypothetical protein
MATLGLTLDKNLSAQKEMKITAINILVKEVLCSENTDGERRIGGSGRHDCDGDMLLNVLRMNIERHLLKNV